PRGARRTPPQACRRRRGGRSGPRPPPGSPGSAETPRRARNPARARRPRTRRAAHRPRRRRPRPARRPPRGTRTASLHGNDPGASRDPQDCGIWWQSMQQAESEKRFAFGRNWRRFLARLDDERIAEAERSLTAILGDVSGKRFLDVGCGSGLFSLCARRLGAAVHSFDFDRDAVSCAEELRARYFADDPRWTAEQGSILDDGLVERLGQFDVVYSWGVLHHTGDLWRALENAARLVKPGGLVWIAIYNALGPVTQGWTAVKRAYVKGVVGRALVIGL